MRHTALCAAVLGLTGCSVINGFDEVMPAVSPSGGGGTVGGGGGTLGPDGSAGGGGTVGPDGSTGGGGQSADASSDGQTGTGGSAGGDALPDAPKLFACSFQWPTPRTIHDFSSGTGQGRYLQRLIVLGQPSQQSVRIVAQTQDQQGYHVYTTSDGLQVNTIDVPGSGRVGEAKRITASETGVLLVGQGSSQDIEVHRFTDNATTQPTQVVLTKPGALNGGANEARFSVYGTGPSFAFATLTNSPDGGSDKTLSYGLYEGAAPDLTSLESNADEHLIRPTAIVHDTDTYVTVVDSPGYAARAIKVGTPPTSHAIGTNAFVTDIEPAPGGKLDVVMAVIDATVALRVGEIDVAKLATLVDSDLALGLQAPDLSSVPFGDSPRFESGLLSLVGPVGAARQQLGVLVIDPEGHVRVNLTPIARPGKVSTGGVAPRDWSSVNASLHLVWAETVAGDGGDYDVIYYNLLSCL
jgi:hypothetical protein